MPYDSLCDFTDAYIECALWSSVVDDVDGEEGEITDDHGREDISEETLATMRADCKAFFEANEEALLCDGGPTGKDGSSQAAMAGHDFWMTRCGHGAGFWDGDWPEPQATILDKAARAFGNVDLYVGDDGLIYGM